VRPTERGEKKPEIRKGKAILKPSKMTSRMEQEKKKRESQRGRKPQQGGKNDQGNSQKRAKKSI